MSKYKRKRRRQPEPDVEPKELGECGGQQRVFLFETRDETRNKIVGGLKKMGYAIDNPLDVNEGQELINSVGYDILVIDADDERTMKLTSLLLDHDTPNKGAPIILTTSREEFLGGRDWLTSDEVGYKDVVLKSPTCEEVLDSVKKHIKTKVR